MRRIYATGVGRRQQGGRGRRCTPDGVLVRFDASYRLGTFVGVVASACSGKPLDRLSGSATSRATVAIRSRSDNWLGAGAMFGIPIISAPDFQRLQRPNDGRSEVHTPQRARASANGSPRRSSSSRRPVPQRDRRGCSPRREDCQRVRDIYFLGGLACGLCGRHPVTAQWCLLSRPRAARRARCASNLSGRSRDGEAYADQ